MSEFNMFALPNGIRAMHKQVLNTKIVHCGLMLDIGSRDEKTHQEGLAHFWEHMAFKGTKRRKAFHILSRLESVGGELNAYTTKEKICFYASILEDHIEKAVDLLADITFNSVFPEKQMEKERNVILEEMAMYLDSPEDNIMDEFDTVIYQQHSLGHNILGTKNQIESYQKADLEAFISENLNTHKIIFSIVGNLSFEKVKHLTTKYFSGFQEQAPEQMREKYTGYIAQTKLIKKTLNQAHCAMGCTAYELSNDKRLPFMLLANILGGPGMNSRLNLSIREKYGFVYGIDAHYNPFIDSGMFSISFATENKQLYRCVDLVLKELRLLREKPLGQLQLHRAKEQFIGQLAMAEENNTNLMLALAKSMLDLGDMESLSSIIEKIRNTESNELQDIANEILVEDELSFLYYKPV